jgi:hypothetical protein
MDDAGLDHALALSQRCAQLGSTWKPNWSQRKLAKQLQYADRAVSASW